jgi:hypothetical protein
MRACSAERPLASQSQVGNELQIAIVLCAGQIVQKSAAAADHLEQSATRVIVVLVAPQVLGQSIDAVGEQSDLHVGRASVASVEPVLLDDSGSIGLNNGHNYVYSSPLRL